MFIYLSLRDGHFDRLLLHGLHALSSRDFVTDSAASYTTSVDYMYQTEFSLMQEFQKMLNRTH